MAGDDFKELLPAILHGDRFPSRDLLMAEDQFRNMRKSLDEIDKNIEAMKKLALCKPQAE